MTSAKNSHPKNSDKNSLPKSTAWEYAVVKYLSATVIEGILERHPLVTYFIFQEELEDGLQIMRGYLELKQSKDSNYVTNIFPQVEYVAPYKGGRHAALVDFAREDNRKPRTYTKVYSNPRK